MSHKLHLLVIDPQNDFCDPKGSLSVPNALEDMERLSTLIDRLSDKIDDIHCTVDSHHKVDIAHPIWWKDSSGKHPDPFTIITYSDVESGKWTTTQPGFYKRSLQYVQQLEKNGKYPLCVWPEHCLIGSWGHNIVPQLYDAFNRWENSFTMVNYVTKGSNMWSEHYSAIKADVPDPNDPSTQINTALIDILQSDADIIAVAGEASSHCVATTVMDIVECFNDDKYAQKIVLLEDCMSPVPGFENLAEDFFTFAHNHNVQISNSVDFLK